MQVGGASLSFQYWLSGWRAWMPQRSCPASTAGLVLRGPLVCSCRQRVVGSSSLPWVNAGPRGSCPSGNECRPLSTDLGQHGTAYRWKRHWGPRLVCSLASRRCWSWKHPSHCHLRVPGQSCRHGRAWSSTLTLEDTQCVQGLSKVPPCWRCQKLLSGQWILSRGACSVQCTSLEVVSQRISCLQCSGQDWSHTVPQGESFQRLWWVC